MVHHIIAVIASVTALTVGGFNICSACATSFTEISTIFLHIRYYMIKAKVADGKPFLIVMIVFIFTFIYARLYLQVFVAMRMIDGFKREYENILKRQPIVLKMQYTANLMMVFLFILNLYWLSLLHKGVMKVLKKGLKEGGKYGEREHIKKVDKETKQD